MLRQIRSLTLPPRFDSSSLAHTSAEPRGTTRFRRTTGVRPISSRADPATRFGTGMKLDASGPSEHFEGVRSQRRYIHPRASRGEANAGAAVKRTVVLF